MKTDLLRGKLTEKRKTYKDLSVATNKSINTICQKVNGNTEFTCKEATIIVDLLELSNEEKANIFLS